MLVRIGKLQVEVKDKKCPTRPCYALGFDKGTFSQGRGYMSYHTDEKGRRVEKPVCGTRFYRGCPTNSICGTCRMGLVLAIGEACDRYGCAGVTVQRDHEEKA